MTSYSTPVTRFAPSPTGFLHIGGVRTAIFNWLYARAKGGTFLVRIEDSDKARSTPEACEAIRDALVWMGLESDAPLISQAAQIDRHLAVVQQLLDNGQAYRCYATPEELEAMRAKAKAEGLPRAYDGTWRDRDPSKAPDGAPYVVRFRAVQKGSSTIEDAVQGSVTRLNASADDLVLLRADGTPTYNLCVVVDDHDMGVTHVIRGDDHLNNAFRQKQIYQALGWSVPTFAHIPLIHGTDGAKLSKRHAALGIEAYRDLGYSPEGLFSYLLKLGWSHGDEDIVERRQAIEIFDLSGIGKSPSRLDLDKLKSVNKMLLGRAEPADLLDAALAFADKKVDREARERLLRAMPALQARSATYKDLAAQFYIFLNEPPLELDEGAAKALDENGRAVLRTIEPKLLALEIWESEVIQTTIKGFAKEKGVELAKVFQPLRAALTGSLVSLGVEKLAYAFGKEKTLKHIRSALC